MPQSRPDFTSTRALADRKLGAMRALAFRAAICGLVTGCAASPRGGADAPAATPATGEVGSAAPDSAAPGATDTGAPSASGSPSEPAGRDLMPDTEPDPSRSLPEVNVRTVGLHIGGGPNDAASKAPFREAVERRFDALLECYKKVDDPEKGGTFGVDMFIRREGGNPEVRQPRTGMKGSEFRDCVKTVFGEVEFSRPAKGPTVISYSVRFEVSDPTRAEE